MVKKVTFTISFILTNIILLASDRYRPRIFEDIGLPDGDEISESLAIALPLILFGFVITYISTRSEKSKNQGSNWGCLGIIILLIGGFFLLPLLAWVEVIFSSILSLGLCLIIIGIIVGLIYNSLKNK